VSSDTWGKKRRAVFLDRDGTINEEKDYLHRIEDFVFIPGAPEAIRRLRGAGFLVIVITNQSGVGRGFYDMAEVEHLHRHIQGELGKAGTAIDGFYVCPHHPEDGKGGYRRNCECRKGQPGMVLAAAAEFDLDLASSFMVGDKEVDIEAGERAGCIPLLVLTGFGRTEARKVGPERAARFASLAEAADFILAYKSRK